MNSQDELAWEKTKYNLLEYFWSTSVISAKNEKNLPFFIKQVDIFSDFSDLEMFDLIKFIHVRNFSKGEVVFESDDYGIGFYIILSGSLEISSQNKKKNKALSKDVLWRKKFNIGKGKKRC